MGAEQSDTDEKFSRQELEYAIKSLEGYKDYSDDRLLSRLRLIRKYIDFRRN